LAVLIGLSYVAAVVFVLLLTLLPTFAQAEVRVALLTGNQSYSARRFHARVLGTREFARLFAANGFEVLSCKSIA
jgi:hypothetical protein